MITTIKQTLKSSNEKYLASALKYRITLLNELKSKWISVRRSNLLKLLYRNVFLVLGYLPAKRNVIIFESFLGKQYSDNPRAIYEYMQENTPQYNMYWSVDRRTYRVVLKVKELNISDVFLSDGYY